jgi:ubiquinone/menaquinone biosynthesis C-methylase UbiE
MGLYARVIFPRLCDLALNNPIVAAHRRKLLANVEGEILEIGFGSGLNLAQYPDSVRKITIVDPNTGMNRRAQTRIQQSGISVDQRLLSSEQLPFPDNTFDSVVSTFTMCSIRALDLALAEIRRVLRPGGRFLYLEHGLSPDPGVSKWQHRLNWLQMRIGDGCRLDRNMRELVCNQGFSPQSSDEFYMDKTPKTHGYTYRGIVTKAS